jgi:protein-disulfide isomerase
MHRRHLNRVLNLAALGATFTASWVALAQVRSKFFPTLTIAASDTSTVDNWRAYGEVGIRLGPASATVTIVEFGDYQCPFCAAAHEYLQGLREKYPQQVAVIFRHFPLHGLAMDAAVAAECSGHMGAFERYHNLLFEQYDRLGEQPWTSLARHVGLADTLLFAACLTDESTFSAIARDTLAASGLGVTGTPTFLINDLLVRGFLRAERMNELVMNALDDAADK